MNLPDINGWVGLIQQAHPNHEQALQWMRTVDRASQVVFCRMTQLGLLRVLSGVYATGVKPMTQREAWNTYDALFDDERVVFLEEPRELEYRLRELSKRNEVTPKRWSDDYLIAFAETANLTLVTFDRALAGRVSSSILLTP